MTDFLAGMNLEPAAPDFASMQAAVLAAAIKGNSDVRAQLTQVQSAFEEPFRTVASVVVQKLTAGDYLDEHLLGEALHGHRLIRRGLAGTPEELTTNQIINWIFTSEVNPDQSLAYVSMLRTRVLAKRKDELNDRVIGLTKTHGGDLGRLIAALEELVLENGRLTSTLDAFPTELLQVIPYAKELEERQRGVDFQGLDSGFSHYNRICNGLDTGLTILAAPPGLGKTSLLWQMFCQAAKINNVPVVFFSLEQSKAELRDKALARFSKLEYRHIQRGRLRADNPWHWAQLLQALQEYALISHYITIVEGDDSTTVDTILGVAKSKMAQSRADRCLIGLDYLQILPARPVDAGRLTSAKDRIDLHVSALRRIARKLKSPVIAISSENRSGYGKSRQMDVFKESGAIEYSADIAMVLARSRQCGDNGADFRLLDCNIIKNRNGETGVVKFKFYPKRMEFVETGSEKLPDELSE